MSRKQENERRLPLTEELSRPRGHSSPLAEQQVRYSSCGWQLLSRSSQQLQQREQLKVLRKLDTGMSDVLAPALGLKKWKQTLICAYPKLDQVREEESNHPDYRGIIGSEFTLEG
jgi:hypothetical protein